MCDGLIISHGSSTYFRNISTPMLICHSKCKDCTLILYMFSMCSLIFCFWRYIYINLAVIIYWTSTHKHMVFWFGTNLLLIICVWITYYDLWMFLIFYFLKMMAERRSSSQGTTPARQDHLNHRSNHNDEGWFFLPVVRLILYLKISHWAVLAIKYI